MTNTVIIIPVNQDTRPTAFYSSFQTPQGVRVDLTINTREQGVADAVTAQAGTLGWTQVPTSSVTPLWQIPFMVAVGLLFLGFGLFIILALLGAVGWLPHHIEVARRTIFEAEYMDNFDIITYALKQFGRGAIISWVPLSVVAMVAEVASRKEA